MTGVDVGIIIIAVHYTMTSVHAIVPAVMSTVPGKAAAAAVMMPSVMAPAVIPGAVVGAPGTVAVPAGAVPGIVPGPTTVPEGIAPAPAVPGVIPPGVVPGIGMTPGRIPAVVVAGTPPGVVPGIVPSVVIYIDSVAFNFGFVKPAEPRLIGFTVVKCVHVDCILIYSLSDSAVAVVHHGDASPFGTAVDAVVINRRIIAGRAARCEPERCEER